MRTVLYFHCTRGRSFQGGFKTFTMSQSEEEQGCMNPSGGEVEEEEEEEEDTPQAALTPDASLPEDPSFATTDVTASSAFQCLEEFLSLGIISQNKAAKLKSSYRLLCETLKSSQDSELHVLGEAKRCRAELQRLQAGLERAEEQSTSEQPESEVNELRQHLLQACNELKAAEDREYKTQHRLRCLWEEKRYLQKENEFQPEPAELESRTKVLQEKHEDLRKEVSERRLEVRSLTEDVEIHETQILREQKELEDKTEIIELKEAERARLISIPEQVLKEIERKQSKKESAMKKMETLNVEISEMEQHVKEVEERNLVLRWKKKEMNEELEGVTAKVEGGQRESRQLLKEQEVSREEEAECTGNRGILEMKLQNIMCDRKHLHESQSVQLKEKNRQTQALKRMEQALTLANEQLEHTQSIYNDVKSQLDAVPNQEARVQQRMALQGEVDALKVGFGLQLSVAEEESQKTQQSGLIQDLLRESNRLREELHNLSCLMQIKVEERGQKHRDLLRAEQLNQHIRAELREKDQIIMDHKKLNATLQRRVLQYCKLCNMITEEKNKYVKLKQIASQTITELTEQIKVLGNETEIQRSIVIIKNRSLTKARMRLSNSSKIRDKLNNDISKVAWKHRQITQEYEDDKLELMKLTEMINVQEQALLETNRNHETAIQRRNSLGVQLLEHEEVLFSSYEKVNIQEAAITKGYMTLETLGKETRDLQLEINEEERQIDLKKKELPLRKKSEEDITMLQIELSEARDKTLKGLNRTIGYKELKGNDPTTEELIKKIEQLEMSLSDQERRLLEKRLLVDQVTRLSQPLGERAENCQQDRLSLAKKLNELRTQVIDSNQRMMAVSAELSMKHATALSLQQEIKEKEFQMDRCQRQPEEGLPTCPELEKEWRRMLRDRKRRQRDKEERERPLDHMPEDKLLVR
ncbi:coiled-coil domain-containing protein 146 isoform X2 [Pseudochaenichthys georgianus]|uniref:coiled-coil domain-containing protein 146 isoform X2 n=1 Tax=Pseudochaenichthys georgianus TaxID=52239 RepID=UPI00146CE06F|nr:coiled-coil domain-containing protein 146 isoform X3 [Pseudochaenichthys georgianus]